jgi:hypothetical protein
MSNYRPNRQAPAALFILTVLMAGALVVALPGRLNARDPGINQPGPAGNINRRGIGR